MTHLRRAILVLVVIACGPSGPIGQPAGSNNFDDPDQPGQQGVNTGAADAGYDAFGAPCVSARDCPAAFLCSYALADGGNCSPKGVCLPYTPTAGCDASVACGCDNSEVLLCAPAGYAPAPVQRLGACDGSVPPSDAGSDGDQQD